MWFITNKFFFLTAYVTRDPDTRQLTLQTGSLVLADNGICCIGKNEK